MPTCSSRPGRAATYLPKLGFGTSGAAGVVSVGPDRNSAPSIVATFRLVVLKMLKTSAINSTRVVANGSAFVTRTLNWLNDGPDSPNRGTPAARSEFLPSPLKSYPRRWVQGCPEPYS